MKTLNGWFATIGVSGGVAMAGVLAIGGGAAALHQSALLSRSHAIPLVIQPAALVSPSSGPNAATGSDDRGVDANGAADDRGVNANDAAADRGVDASDAADDRGVDAAGPSPAATAEPDSSRGRGPGGPAAVIAASSPGGSSGHSASGTDDSGHRGGSDD